MAPLGSVTSLRRSPSPAPLKLLHERDAVGEDARPPAITIAGSVEARRRASRRRTRCRPPAITIAGSVEA